MSVMNHAATLRMSQEELSARLMLGSLEQFFLNLTSSTLKALGVDTTDIERKKELIRQLVGFGQFDGITQALTVTLLSEPVSFLERMVSAEHFDASLEVKFATGRKIGWCHAVAIVNKALNPSWRLIHGYSCGEFNHSWLIDSEGVLIEPTPVGRSSYVGFEVSLEEHVLQFGSMVDDLVKDTWFTPEICQLWRDYRSKS